jgi:hypothetical protein
MQMFNWFTEMNFVIRFTLLAVGTISSQQFRCNWICLVALCQNVKTRSLLSALQVYKQKFKVVGPARPGKTNMFL